MIGTEQHPSSATTRVTEQSFLESTLLTSSGGGAFSGWPTAATELNYMQLEKAQGKFFNKTKATRGRKLECAYTTGLWAGSTVLIA